MVHPVDSQKCILLHPTRLYRPRTQPVFTNEQLTTDSKHKQVANNAIF